MKRRYQSDEVLFPAVLSVEKSGVEVVEAQDELSALVALFFVGDALCRLCFHLAKLKAIL